MHDNAPPDLSSTAPELSQPTSHKQHRSSYATLLDNLTPKEDPTP